MHTQKPRTGRRRSWRWILPVGLLTVLGFAWLAVSVMIGSYERRMQELIQQRRAAGDMVTWEDVLQALGTVPDDLNFAHTLDRHGAALDALRPRMIDKRIELFECECDHYEGIVPEDVRQARAVVAEHAELLAALAGLSGDHVIVASSESLDSGLLSDGSMKLLTRLRTVGHLLVLDGKLRLIDGDAEGAVRQAVAVTCLSKAMSREPMIVAALVRNGLDASALQLLQQILRAGTVEEAMLVEFQARLAEMDAEDRLKWPLMGERALIMHMLLGPGAPAPVAAIAKPVHRFMATRGGVMVFNQFSRMIDARHDPMELISVGQAADAAAQSAGMLNSYGAMIMPSMSRAFVLHTRLIAQMRASQAMLAAERYRLAHSRFPTSWEDLVPDYLAAIPLDPFDSRPLRLHIAADRLVIYSIDEDGVDNQGRLQKLDPAGQPQEHDIGCALYLPQHRGLTFAPEPEAE